MSPLIALTLTAALAAPAAPVPRTETPLVARAARIAADSAPMSPSSASVIAHAPWTQPGGDSLKNGAVAGAIVGALAFGGFVAYLCHATNETNDEHAALKCGVRGGIMGAAGGAALGAGVDALFTRATGARVRVRF